MSYGIIRISKITSGSVKGIEIHDQREKNHSNTNSDINFLKSSLNYDLHNYNKVNFNSEVKSRIEKLNLKKRVRKDAIVMCQCLITSDNDFFSNISEDEQRRFFRSAYEFICKRYGKDNIISAIVHLDEKTPHIHINFVPVTSDGRLCAKDLFKRKDLLQLHDDFYKFNKSRGYNLQRGESREIIQKHLSTEEYKITTAYKEIEFKRADIEDMKKELTELNNALKMSCKGVEKILKDIKHIDTIKTKNVLGGQIKLNKDDFDYLVNLAKGIFFLKNENENLSKISKEYNKLKKESDFKISEKLKLYKEIERLKKDNSNLFSKFNEIIKYLEYKNLLIDFQEYQIEKEKMELNSKGILKFKDMEM